ncbi:Hsp20/alpha crystallin family protein [Planctomicrobium sp. SH527]|uniref:Hsp20/alpha crystallin family protein n=1 Tax=Planctomicrobium sp. SH527 TaxID=3448123 RepID=UPI003F5C1380
MSCECVTSSVVDGCGSVEVRDLSPVADLYESEQGYSIELELPGIAAEDVSVTVDQDVLTVDATGAKGAAGQSRPLRHFNRAFRLPKSIDRSGISVEIRSGLLVVKLPKQLSSQRVVLQVKTAET